MLDRVEEVVVTQEMRGMFKAVRKRMDITATIRPGSVLSALSDNTIHGGGELETRPSLSMTFKDGFGLPQPRNSLDGNNRVRLIQLNTRKCCSRICVRQFQCNRP